MKEKASDPRLLILLGLSVNAAIVAANPASAIAILTVALIAWLLIGGMPRAGFLFWLALQGAIGLVFCITWFLGWDTAESSIWGFLRWSAGLTGGVMVFLWAGSESVARTLIQLPVVPAVLSKPLGFALRVIPVLDQEIEAHRRNRRLLELLEPKRKRRTGFAHAIGEILSQTVDRIDKIVGQIEERGYHPSMFGKSTTIELSFGNFVAGTAAALAILIGSLSHFTK